MYAVLSRAIRIRVALRDRVGVSEFSLPGYGLTHRRQWWRLRVDGKGCQTWWRDCGGYGRRWSLIQDRTLYGLT